jgi:Chlamydia polymorphic membrane protein (Chlamydia_PMP) repeat
MNTQRKTFNSNTCRILFAASLSALCLIALSAQAATITVTNTNDSGAGSLRQAIVDAVNGDTIDFGVTGTITLTTGQLLVDKSITIHGPGSDHLTVDGNHANRIFYVGNVGVTAAIAGLTITNGNAGNSGGGGIYNDSSTLTVSNCTISGNSSPGVFGLGGGLYNDVPFGNGTLEVLNCTVSGNSAGDNGGGIYNYGGSNTATLKVINSTISGNSAHFYGGGIFNISAYGGSAPADVLNSTFSGNSAVRFGGGIYNIAFGGSAPLDILHSTFSDNSAFSGGAISNFDDGGSATLDLTDTILNASVSGENIHSDGTVTSHGYNLSSDNGGGLLTAMGDQINTDPLLGPLQDNGGPTFTHALLTGSPAIDAGNPNFDPNAFNPPMLYDQRGLGYNRVAHGRIDIGSFEIVVPSYAGQVQPPINADGSSNFNFRRGVVPVKFNLTLGGVATCDLPPATIAVTRTAGGVIGQVNESDYSGNADTGSNFRIGSCQYVYNLNARALGVGTYRIDILINGQVVGSATFGLN